MNYNLFKIFLVLLVLSTYSCKNSKNNTSFSDVELSLIELRNEPIIKPGDKGTENNKYGFEGGTAHKVNNVYYIFSTEVFDDPKTSAVKLALWKSEDGLKFSRLSTIAETNYNWNDTTYKMSPWSPMVVFDDAKSRWSLFYVGYRRKPNATDIWNMSGKINRLDSQTPGIEGIEGPYKSGDWVSIDKKGDKWEGPAELVSFYPYKVNDAWYAFYGSNSAPEFIDPLSKPQNKNEAKILFHVGLAKSDSMVGHYKRLSESNPVLMDPEFIENPVVTKIHDSLYIVVYDGGNKNAISYSWSKNGIDWKKEKLIQLPSPPAWLNAVRTPLCLISEGKDEYTIFFTAFDGVNPNKDLPLWHDGFGHVGKAKVKLKCN